MNIQEIYQRAAKFAAVAHAAQKVPGLEANYMLHLSNVAMEVLLAHQHAADFDLAYAIQLALLHDTLEDTAINEQTLTAQFGEKITAGVLALTKDPALPKTESMKDSLRRIKQLEHEVALTKLADRITNLQVPPKFWDKAKRNAYIDQAGIILQELGYANLFLQKRLKSKIDHYRQFFCQ